MTDEQFRDAMISHMEQQTTFLCEINKALSAVKTVAGFLTGAFTLIAGGFGLLEFFKQIRGR